MRSVIFPSSPVDATHARKANRRCRRNGFALVDMLSMMTTIGLLLAFSAAVLNQAFVTHYGALEHLQSMVGLQDTCDRMREDLHHAEAVEIESQSKLLVGYPGGRSIRYAYQDSEMIRTTIVDGSPLGIETWQFPDAATVRWESDSDGELSLVTCVIEQAENAGPLRQIRWVSRVGVFAGEQYGSSKGDDNSK